MRSAKLVGLVLLGVLVGWFASGSLGAEAQQVPSGRLTAIPVRNPTTPGAQGSYFLKDSKTGACWLVIRSRDDINAALATAPRESCQEEGEITK
jgi:hypothetical protein